MKPNLTDEEVKKVIAKNHRHSEVNTLRVSAKQHLKLIKGVNSA